MKTLSLIKRFPLFIFIFISTQSYSQLDGFAIYGKKSDNLGAKFGFGSFMKFTVPVNQDADAITADVTIMTLDDFDVLFTSFKAGYKFTLNRSGYGFYIEPQVGYAIGQDYDEEPKGIVAVGNIGYMFKPWGGVRFDISLRAENIFSQIGTYNFVGLRLAHNFSLFKRREE